MSNSLKKCFNLPYIQFLFIIIIIKKIVISLLPNICVVDLQMHLTADVYPSV